MSTLEITAATKVTMLKQLVAGKDLDFVAAATKIPRDTVLDVVSKHGYPDQDRMGWAVDMLIQGRDSIPERPADNHRGLPLPAQAIQAIARANTQPAGPRPPVQGTPSRPTGYALTPPAPTARPVHTSTAELLHQASESDLARTRALGGKISTLLADLTLRITDEQEAHEAKAAAEKNAAAVAARIAVLQAEIDKLKGGKRAKKPNTEGITSTPRESTRKYGLHPGEHSCTTPGCDRTFDTIQGAVTHRRRAHEGFNPHAAAS